MSPSSLEGPTTSKAEASRPVSSSATITSDTTHIAEKDGEQTGAGETRQQSIAENEEDAIKKEVKQLEGSSDADWETDPLNPRNWSSSRKWASTAVISLYTFIPPLASSMMAPGLPDVAERYNITSPTIIALTLVIFLLSFALAPLVIAPISEMYGRTWVYHIANIFSVGFSLGCAFSPNVTSLIVFRFLAGFSGAAPVALGGGSIADMFAERERASAMALYSLGPLVGPAVGPVAGGFIAMKIGVKYVFVVIAGISGIASVVGIPLLRETYAPVIRERLLIKEGDPEKGHEIESKALAARAGNTRMGGMTKSQYLKVNMVRPMVLLTRSLICFMLSLYMAFLYGIYYLMFATFADLFGHTYGFSIGTGGLVYLGLGIGFFVATFLGGRIGDKVYHRLAQKNGGIGTPEMRIPILIIGSFLIPVGLFWYGWSAEAKIHWMMPIIGTAIFAFGMMTIYLPIQLYLVDSFQYAASAVSAASVFRSLLGFAFPLFASKLFLAMGVGGGNSFLAGLSIVLGIPFPVWLYYKGAELRMKSQYTRR